MRVQLECEEHAVDGKQDEAQSTRHVEQVGELLADGRLSRRAPDCIDRVRRVGISIVVCSWQNDSSELFFELLTPARECSIYSQ